MLRNTKLISVELAADIEVNTNFVLPQRGNTILRRVNNYRQTQREIVKPITQALDQNRYQIPANNTTIGFKNPSVLQNQKSFRAQSINCKNFMLPDSPRVTNYEFTLPYEEIKPQRKTRPASTNVASDYIRQPKTEYSQNQEFQYYDAVKQASKILRKNMVLNFADQIQRTLPLAPQTVQLQQNLVVSQGKINSALRQSVSRTERRLKSTAREQIKGVNSVSPKHAQESKERDCISQKVSNKMVPPVKNNFEHAAVLTGRLIGERPKSMRPGHHNFAQIINMQNIGTNSKEFVIAGVLSETKASSDALKSHNLKPKSVIPQTTTFSQNTELNGLTEKNSLQQIHIKVKPLIQNFDPSNIKQFNQYQIYWPQSRTSKDDFKTVKFINFLQKGYFKQAATALNSVSEGYPGLIFNKGLLALVENKPKEALKILEGFDEAQHNYNIAKKQIDYMQVTKDFDPSQIVNENYFTRTYPYGYKNETQNAEEKPIKPVLNEWDFFLMQIKKYRKEDFQRFVEDKKYFDKIIARANHICDEESKLIPNVITRIMKDPDVENSETEKIINVTLQRDTVLRDAPNLIADKALEEVFIEMINMQSTYCVGVKDPINESYDMLVEGLRSFDEKFSLETFANEYLIKSKNGVAEIQNLLRTYDVQDKLIIRARTFIISCFDVENTPDQNDYALNCLLRIVRDQKELKLKRTIDPDRFQIEAIFTHLVDDIITASRNQKGPGALAQDDQYWIDQLNFHKELSGRSDQVVVMKVAEISKQHMDELQSLERDLNRPDYYDKLEPNRIARNLKVEIYKKLEETWQRHIKKPLSDQEKNVVKQEIQDVMLEIEQTAKKNLEIIKENQLFQQKLESDIAKGVYVQPKKQKRINVNQQFKESLRKKIHQKIQESIDKKKDNDSDYQISCDDNNDDEMDEERKKIQQFVFHEGHMKVTSDQVQTGTSMLNLWADSSGAVNLRKALHKIQLMCEDQNIIFDKDAIRLAPLMEKWGIEAEKNKKDYDQELKKSEEVQIKKERPKIGQEITGKMLQYLQKSFEDIKDLFQSQLNKLDDVLVENLRFFSIIDRNVRLAIYQSIELVHFAEKGTLIESDVDETDYVYIVVQGFVDYMLFKFDTKVTVVAATYRAGEVFGDASIQRQYFDVFKCLSKDRKYLETSCDNVYALRIPKRHFVDSIFAQMRVELMYKITMFRNTDYFKELSPYSLVMFASICDVMDYKYGEIIIEQGEKPNACYLIAHGQCQSFYHYVEQQSMNVSKYARKVLQTNNSKPFIQSKLDYKNLPSQYMQKTRTNSANKVSKRAKNMTIQKIEQQQDKVELDAPQMKRAFYHGIISENVEKQTVQYENHVVFGDIRQGNVFGARTLLDYPTFQKHVSQNSLRFAEQLGLVAEDWIDNLREKRQAELQKQNLSQTDVLLKAYQQQQKFCKECFEQRKPACECALKDLTDEQKKKFTELSKADAFTKNLEEQHIVVNDPEDLSKSFSVASNEIRSTSQITDFKVQGKDSQGEATNESRLKHRKTSNFSKSTRRQQTKESEEDLTEETCQRMFIDYMHDNLIRSQTSIMVTSATAKLIVIRKEDKTFLNEALKQSIDRVIIEQNFKDHDRPFPNFKLVQKSIEEARGWICHKKKTEETILKEAKLDRVSNKLLV